MAKMNIKTKKHNDNRWAINDKVFTDNFMVASLIELSNVGSGLIDGIIISRMLSKESMAAFGIAFPIYSIIAIFFGLFATGMQTITSQELGRGNVKECNRLFCATFYISAIFSLFMMLTGFASSGYIAVLLGASGSGSYLKDGASAFISGICIGIPAFLLDAVLAPAIQMDSGRKRVLVSVIVDAAVDILFDIIAVYLGLGLFGIGLATSVGRYVRLLVLMLHFRNKTRMLHFVKLKTNFREFIRLLSYGTEKAIRRLGNVIRPVLVNKMILYYGGILAMTAMSVRGNVCNLTDVFAVGLADVVGLLAGIYYGEKNEEAINRLGSLVHHFCFLFCGTVMALLIIFVYPIARFYTDKNGEALLFTSIALVGVALQCPLHALVRSRICYLQRIQKTRIMQMLILLSTLVYPIVSAFLLGKIFGVYGVLLCYTAGDFLTLVTTWVYYSVKKKKLIPSVQDYLNLPERFEPGPADIISYHIRNLKDIHVTTDQIKLFCNGHKLDHKIGNRASVCFEEMATNIVKYGFPENKTKAPIIDLRVVLLDDRLMIRLQDNCPQYDVSARIASLSKDSRAKDSSGLGTWLANQLADDIRYVYSFETNTVFIEFNII